MSDADGITATEVKETKSNGLCDALGCENKATHEVFIHLRCHALHKAAATERVCVVCTEHKAITLNEICNEESWNKLCIELIMAGRKLPKRKFSYLAFVPLKMKVVK